MTQRTPIFPRETVELHFPPPSAIRRFTFSLWEMAALTGVLSRVFRLFVVGHGATGWWFVGSTFVAGLALLLGMVTAHLANYPLHRWPARVAGFILVEAAAEIAVSAILIAAGREPIGSVRAQFADLPDIATRTLLLRGSAIVLWSLLLAGTVRLVRNRLVQEDAEPTG
jgi:hypothetical protein